MKTIEVLYSEFSNMYGEIYNAMLLENCKKVKVIYTKFNDEPYFVKHKVDMIYMGNIRDNRTYLILDKLKPHRDKLKKMVDDNVIFLLTGNALELFGKYILENGKKTKALDIMNYYVEKDFTKKHASWFMGKFNDIEIIGHRNQFSKCFDIKHSFIDVLGGKGSDLASKKEGIHYKNFYATYLLGPFLIMNPYFVKHLYGLLGITDKIPYEEDAIAAYNERIAYFRRENARFIITDHG